MQRRHADFLPILLTLTLVFPALALGQETDAHQLMSVWAGNLPLILTAPHGGREPIPGVEQRRGAGVAQFTTGRDTNTDMLAEAVALKLRRLLGHTPFLVVARFDRKYLDVNRPINGAYESVAAKPYYDAFHRAIKEAADKVRAQWDGGLLLDLHGQGAQVEAIYRGTDNGETVATLLEQHGKEALVGTHSIFGQLAARGYKILPELRDSERENRYVGGYIARTYGSHRGTKINAIQLEIGTRLRANDNLERTATDLSHAIEVFARRYLLPQSDNSSGSLP
jgi:N-formylglutamate amidohydrolase